MKKPELLLVAILGGFTATFLFLSRDYNSTAAFFPKVIAVATLLFLTGGIARRKFSSMGSDPSLPDFKPATIALQAAYVASIYVIGFVLATLLYIVVAPIQLRYERWTVAIVTSIVLTLLLAGSFMWLFDIQLPPGAIWEMF